MKRQDKILKQIELQYEIVTKAKVNLVNCGSCGSVLFHSTKDKKIECPFCDFKSNPCDFPDYFYTGLELSAEFEEVEKTKLKEYEVYKNGTQQGTVKAKNIKEARLIVFSWYGEHREVYRA
jgi:uncharacterized Zn finger protein (UPF0148 family)